LRAVKCRSEHRNAKDEGGFKHKFGPFYPRVVVAICWYLILG
jgi:hypothetical protein